MIELIIGNSISQIKGLDLDTDKRLRKLISYDPSPMEKHYSGYRARPQSLIDKRGFFPTGLMGRVLKSGLYDASWLITDSTTKPKAILGLFEETELPTPYPEQQEAVNVCKSLHRGIVSAVTGVGKSVIAGHLVKVLSVPTLIVVPTLTLKKQLSDSFKEWFGGSSVGPLGIGPITIENVDSLPLDASKYNQYHCLIIDEFHRSAARTYRKLNMKAWNSIYYRFGLTATPIRSQDNEQILLESILSDVIYEIPYQLAVDKGYIVPVRAYYIELPKQKTEAKTWARVYSELIVNNKVRNGIIISLLNNIGTKSCLCLVKEISHGKYLSVETNASFASGKQENSDQLIENFCLGGSSLIGTVGLLGTGVDTKPTEFIILAAGGKSPIQLQQNIGRGLRIYPGKTHCTVILFKDPSHKWLLTHFRIQVRILKEAYGIKPERIEIYDL